MCFCVFLFKVFKAIEKACVDLLIFSILKLSNGGTVRFIALFLMFLPFTAMAEVLPLYDALRGTYTACVGIDEELADLKKKAGINTAVTVVGTATGVGATVTGVVKSSKDSKIESLEIKLEQLREIESKNQQQESVENNFDAFASEFETSYSSIAQQLKDYQSEIDKLTEQSKNLGNWRTGLLAGSTATNIAGAAISGTNKVSAGLKEQINSCISAVDTLQQSMMQARLNGEDITEAQRIVEACKEYEYVDTSKIDNRAKGAMISSVVGATTGLAGTITSATANTDKTRNDNTASGNQKEKNLNTASNVLSGVTTVASATATGFNAAQISAIKKVAEVAEKCTGVLK